MDIIKTKRGEEMDENVANKVKRKNGFNQKKLYDNLFIASFLFYPILLFCVFWVYTNFDSILLGFRKYDELNNPSFAGLANFKDFINYVILNGDPRWGIAFKNTLKMYLIPLIPCNLCYIFFAYILFKHCPAHRILRFIVLLPQIIAGFILALVFKRFVEQALPGIMSELFGLTDFPNLLWDKETAFGTQLFYVIWISFSTNLIVYPNAMKEIDTAILEAAQIDGVQNMFQELWYIIVPLIYPTMCTFIITGFSGMIMAGGAVPTFYYFNAPTHVVNVGYLYWIQMTNADSFIDYPLYAAGGLMLTVIIAPLTMLLRWALDKYGPSTEGY